MSVLGDPGELASQADVTLLRGAQQVVPAAEREILLVEDNPDDVMLTLRAFRKNSINNHVAVATDGEEALRYLLIDGDGDGNGNESAPLPLIVLLDINMPKVSGLDVLRKIRAHRRTRYLPVVVLTTSSEERDIVESYDLGANSYVRKPVVFDSFTDAIRVLGLYWLLVNESAPGPYGTG